MLIYKTFCGNNLGLLKKDGGLINFNTNGKFDNVRVVKNRFDMIMISSIKDCY
jgi:hypothetical protein